MPAREVDQCSDPTVAARMNAAIDALFNLDRDLFVIGVHERTIAAKFAHHLQSVFGDWHVDCEYNREGHDQKEIALPTGVTSPYPDIIVHRRRQNHEGANLLVIELKLSDNPSAARERRDLLKLPAYVDSLGYRHAVFLKFATRPRDPEVLRVRWFEDLIA